MSPPCQLSRPHLLTPRCFTAVRRARRRGSAVVVADVSNPRRRCTSCKGRHARCTASRCRHLEVCHTNVAVSAPPLLQSARQCGADVDLGWTRSAGRRGGGWQRKRATTESVNPVSRHGASIIAVIRVRDWRCYTRSPTALIRNGRWWRHGIVFGVAACCCDAAAAALLPSRPLRTTAFELLAASAAVPAIRCCEGRRSAMDCITVCVRVSVRVRLRLRARGQMS